MKIQPINCNAYSKPNQSVKKNQKNIVFNGYGDLMYEVLRRDLKTPVEGSSAIIELYHSLIKESSNPAMPIFGTIHEWILTQPIDLIENICKPIRFVDDKLREYVFKSEDELVNILKGKNKNDEAYLANLGKFGFFNSLFDVESARKDMRFVLSSDIGSIELGTTKDKKVYVEQYNRSGYWKKNIYGMFDRISVKEGNTNDSPGAAFYP